MRFKDACKLKIGDEVLVPEGGYSAIIANIFRSEVANQIIFDCDTPEGFERFDMREVEPVTRAPKRKKV